MLHLVHLLLKEELLLHDLLIELQQLDLMPELLLLLPDLLNRFTRIRPCWPMSKCSSLLQSKLSRCLELWPSPLVKSVDNLIQRYSLELLLVVFLSISSFLRVLIWVVIVSSLVEV